FVVAQSRIDPIFRVEEYFAIGFPDAVLLHPFPTITVEGISGNAILLFQSQHAALHEELYSRDGLLDTRSLHTSVHLHINKEKLKQAVSIHHTPVDQILLHKQIADEGLLLIFTKLIIEWLNDLFPV